MSRKITMGAALAALTVAAGCVGGGSSGSASGPGPLTPAPTPTVTANRLPPPPPPPPPVAAPVTPATPAPGTQVAAVDPAAATPPPPPASTAPVTRESVTGAWKVTAGGGNCQIFMALTQWTGGYKAASRGCPGQVADVTAWDVSGSQVVLKDGSGNSVANLSAASGGGYQGTTSGGQAITIYR